MSWRHYCTQCLCNSSVLVNRSGRPEPLCAACFCMAYKRRMVFTFSNVWEKSREEYLWHMKIIWNSSLVESYWNTAVPMAWPVVWVRSCDNSVVEAQHLKYGPSAALQKMFANPDLKDHFPQLLPIWYLALPYQWSPVLAVHWTHMRNFQVRSLGLATGYSLPECEFRKLSTSSSPSHPEPVLWTLMAC